MYSDEPLISATPPPDWPERMGRVIAWYVRSGLFAASIITWIGMVLRLLMEGPRPPFRLSSYVLLLIVVPASAGVIAWKKRAGLTAIAILWVGWLIAAGLDWLIARGLN